MDSIDREILSVLEENGRESYTEVAEKVGVSEGTVRNRVASLEEEGVIKKFTVETERKGMGAIVMVELSTDQGISDVLEELPEEIEVFEVTGEHDLVIRLSRDTPENLNRALDDIRAVDGVKDTRTYSVLKSRRR